MSLVPGIGTSLAAGDILSQALLQTGLSTPIKVEADETNIGKGNFLPCNIQTLANGFLSNIVVSSNSSIHRDILPSTNMISLEPMAQVPSGSNPLSILLSRGECHTSTSTGSSDDKGHYARHMNSTEVVPVPPGTQHNGSSFNSLPPASVNMNVGSLPNCEASGSNNLDIDLGDLLSIHVDTPDIVTPSATHSGSVYSVLGPPNPKVTFQDPGPSTQYQNSYHPVMSQTLAELPDLGIYNILGTSEPDFLDTLDTLDVNSFNESMETSYSQSSATAPQMNSSRPFAQYGTNSSGLVTFPPGSRVTATKMEHSSSLTNLTVGGGQLPHPIGSQFVPPQPKEPSASFKMFRPVMGSGVVHSAVKPTAMKQDAVGDSDDEDDEDYSLADTYANYVPAKLRLGRTHPDSVVESSSLSSVSPPEVYFDLKLPPEVITSGKLSSLQLESVVYTCQQHMNILADGTRAGFLVGDGAGVGKGRTIAGIIYQNYLEGRKKAIWLSVSNDLRLDAVRDLKDIGARKIDVYSLNKFHYGKISGKRNGRVRKGVIFATYSSLIGESTSGGKYRTRFSQLLHWLGSNFEGVIVFDECHKAKNLVPSGASKPSKTGMTVLQLQKKLPKARIVYCSATGASEPKNMAYMSRLGIWGKGTQFDSFQTFIKAVEKRGVGAMEIIAIDMKLRGMYMARQLSFAGVTFSINEVELSDKFVEAYDASVKLWVETRRMFQEAADMMDYDKKKLKTMWGQFWASHQRFFKYMCIAAKVPEAITLTKKALQEGKCVVIGLQSTGEARTLEQLERSDGDLSGFVSTAKGVLETLIRRHFPLPVPDPGLFTVNWNMVNNDPTLPQSCRIKKPRASRKTRLFLPEEEDFNFSDSEDSSGSPERSDSAVECSSDDEGERSSEGSGSSSSESENDEDNNVNPFSCGFSEPWLQKKKKKMKNRKRPHSPSERSADVAKRKKNFSIKPPPHSNQKGKTKTGFNSKKLKFEQVQSPKASTPFPHHGQTTPPNHTNHTCSLANEINRRFATAHAMTDTASVSVDMVNPALDGTEPAGRSLLDAMSSNFTNGAPLSPSSNTYNRNKVVKDMKEELLKKLDILSPYLPTNTLDELIDGLGGTQYVAEMTGRRGRVVSLPGGRIQYQLRTENDVSTEMLNIKEKQRFMDGEKYVAIISEAASSGISLQADRRVKNRKRRVHVTLELPWSADKAIQQFGRTHRSNQISSPEYVFLISALSGEQRFASIVAKRLESLGALTHGDRRATESRDLSKFNVDTKYGRQALESTLKSLVGQEEPTIKMNDYPKNFFEQCSRAMIGVGLLVHKGIGLGPVSIDKDATTMARFLNRILGLPVQLQNQLFSFFSDTLAAVVQQARRSGKWDGGILDFGSAGEHVQVIHTNKYIGDVAYSTATTFLHTVQVERGISYEEAVAKLEVDLCPGEGFYQSKRVCNNKLTVVLLKAADSSGKLFNVYRPNTGRQGRMEKLSMLLKKYKHITVEEGKKWWCAQYTSSLNTCNHAYWQGKCSMSVPGQQCEVGLRRKTYYVLSGSVLGVWSYIEGVFNRHSSNSHRVQIVRVRTDSKKIVGILVPKLCSADMKQTLTRIAQQAEGTQDNPITL